MPGPRTTRLKAPFLKRVYLREDIEGDRSQYPLNLPFLKSGGFSLEFTRAVTVLVGENGTGKSTLLEAIGSGAGFNINGGNANHVFGQERRSPLAPYLRFSWLPKVSKGFFMRAESFFNLATYIDDVGAQFAYGGKSLHERSHGEAFLALFQNRFGGGSLYILDEPEAALSPSRQMIFLKLMRTLEEQNCQLIIATHAPLVMAYPGAQLVSIQPGTLVEIDFRETSHFRLMSEFFRSPDDFVAGAIEG